MNHKTLKQVSKTLFNRTLSIRLLIYQMIAKCIELCVLFTYSVAIEDVRVGAVESECYSLSLTGRSKSREPSYYSFAGTR